jgi:V/A-type H+-transporting ATPase subunit F
VKKIAFVTPPDARYGFNLTGLRQVVTTPDALHTSVLDVTGDPAVGMLVIDERLIAGPAAEQIRDIERRWAGLVVVLPAPAETARPEDDYARRLIRRAIGYQVRVNL